MRMAPPRAFTASNPAHLDLYTVRARLRWYYTLTATVSGWLALAGYTLLVLAFTSETTTLRVSRGVINTLGFCGLVFGYGGALAVAFLSKSILFAYQDVAIPLLTSSSMGLFEVAANQALHRGFSFLPNGAYTIIPLAVASLTTIVSAASTFVIRQRVTRLKKQTQRHIAMDGQEIPLVSMGSYGHGHSNSYAESPGASAMYQQPQGPGWINVNKASSQAIVDVLPDDEAQRRQLIRLLMSKDRNGNNEDTSSTYKIDLPWDESGHQRTRSGSLPTLGTLEPSKKANSKWGISNLVPKLGRQISDSDVMQGFKDPRERRREEIERAGILQNAGMQSPEHMGGFTNNGPPSWNTHGSAPGTPGFGNSTRYA